jgi:hypothetical protein
MPRADHTPDPVSIPWGCFFSSLLGLDSLFFISEQARPRPFLLNHSSIHTLDVDTRLNQDLRESLVIVRGRADKFGRSFTFCGADLDPMRRLTHASPA